MNLHFTLKEKQEYLIKLGYSCRQVKYEPDSIYQDGYVFEVAYKDIPPQEYVEILNCRIEDVFNNEIKRKILEL